MIPQLARLPVLASFAAPAAQILHATRALSTQLTYETVVVTPHPGYAVLQLNRPKALNALSTQV